MAEAVERALRGGEVHHNGGLAAVRIGIDATDGEFADLIIDQQAHTVASFFVQTLADPNAVRVLQEPQGFFGRGRGGSVRGVGLERETLVATFGVYFSDQVEADKRNSFFGLNDDD